ncbi:YegS/Rv2252/BmrU family lipid kinase [Bacteroidales bacterium OttesenSCG-928-I21]|nr:YegS/Rv2252/BmrU family lipid kinase [Bacteroidales bacterium OttesenSCG-928-I21]
MEDKIVFILNPISGFRKFRRTRIESIITKEIKSGKINGKIRYSRYAGHTSEIAKSAVEEGCKFIVVAGGDGSINEVARVLTNTDVALGIIPAGSGNGLARHIKIPFNIKNCLKIIKQKKIQHADVIEVNGKYAISIAGVGFDAIVAERYSKDKNRGFISYVQAAILEYFTYKPEKVKICTDELVIDESIFFMVLANSNQFGYNFRIAPRADLFDGYMDVVIVKNVPLIAAPLSSIKVLTGYANKSLYVSSFKTKKITITRANDGIMNIDGDPHKTGKIVEAKILEKALWLVTP